MTPDSPPGQGPAPPDVCAPGRSPARVAAGWAEAGGSENSLSWRLVRFPASRHRGLPGPPPSLSLQRAEGCRVGWGAGMQKGVLPQTGGWSSTQVWSVVSAFGWHWGLAGRASEAVMVGGRCPNGAGQLARTHPDHTGGRGPPSEQGRAKAWLSLGTSRLRGQPLPAHSLDTSFLWPWALPLALSSLRPHLAAILAEREGCGAAGEIPRGCPSRAGLPPAWPGCGQQGRLRSPPPRLGKGPGGVDCARGQGLLSGSVSPPVSWE